MANVTKFTPEKEQVILDALEQHPSKTRACRKARISRPTFYRWCREHPEFLDRVEQAQAIGIDAVEDAMFTEATDKHDTTAMIFTLKSWRPDRYRETTKKIISGDDEHPIQFVYRELPARIERT